MTKLDSEVNARFLLNEHGDPHFLFYKFNENNILKNWKKNLKKSMATFLANEVKATDRDAMGPTEQFQIMFPLKDKNINHKNYNFLACDWFKNVLFSTNSLVVIGQFVIGQFVIGQFNHG